MKQGLIAPSMMCVDFSEMTSVIEAFEKNGIGYLHIDIMDGEFVPNYTLGTDFCRRLRTMTRIPLDLHLMITRPDNKLDWFQIQPGEYVSVHWESTPHIPRVLARIRELGGKPMLALNPATPLSVLDYVLEDIDGVLLMTVNPGFAGQKLLPSMLEKIIWMNADFRMSILRLTVTSALRMPSGCAWPVPISLLRDRQVFSRLQPRFLKTLRPFRRPFNRGRCLLNE